MPRGRKKQDSLSEMPPHGVYRGSAAALFARKQDRQLVSDRAFRLWHVVAMYNWDGSGCDLTDEKLAGLLETRDRWIIELRKELTDAGLLREYRANGHRLLVPLYPDCPPEREPVATKPDPDEQERAKQEQRAAIIQALQVRNVWAKPAEAIADAMMDAGFDVSQAIAIFENQLQSTITDKEPSGQIALVVYRLKNRQFTPPVTAAQVDLSPEGQHLVNVLVERYGCPPSQTRRAVARALETGFYPAWIELNALRWAAYCDDQRRGRGVATPATFILSKIADGLPCPANIQISPFAPEYSLEQELLKQWAIQSGESVEESEPTQSKEESVKESEPERPKETEPKPEPESPAQDSVEAKIWQTALGQFQMQMSRAVFDTWVRRTTLLSCVDGLAVIGVHSPYAKDWLENRLYSLVVRTLACVVGRDMDVRFVVWNKTPEDEGG